MRQQWWRNIFHTPVLQQQSSPALLRLTYSPECSRARRAYLLTFLLESPLYVLQATLADGLKAWTQPVSFPKSSELLLELLHVSSYC
jgi:hypothetical protein